MSSPFNLQKLYKQEFFTNIKSIINSKGGIDIKSRKFCKRIITLLVILGVLCSLCITSGKSGRENFVPRLSAPTFNNHCYYKDNVFYKSGYGIPNCTAYAWGRAYEIMGSTPKLSTADAGKWFEYNKTNHIYKYGNVAKLGAIACFDNSAGGHVAVVEKIENNIITFSNSAYGGSSFYLSTASIYSSNPGQSGWIFQGYIYLDDFAEKNVSSDKLYSNSFYSVQAEKGLNLRTLPSVDGYVIMTVPKHTQLFITEIVSNNGLIWGGTSYNGYSGYCAIDYADKIS